MQIVGGMGRCSYLPPNVLPCIDQSLTHENGLLREACGGALQPIIRALLNVAEVEIDKIEIR